MALPETLRTWGERFGARLNADIGNDSVHGVNVDQEFALDQIPFNPFYFPGKEEVEADNMVGILRLPVKYAPSVASGFMSMVNWERWSDLERRALRQAADFVTWTALTSPASEGQIIRNRTTPTGLHLVLTELVSDRGER